MSAGFILIALSLVPLAIMWWLCITAPRGWQDEDSETFHFGERDE